MESQNAATTRDPSKLLFRTIPTLQSPLVKMLTSFEIMLWASQMVLAAGLVSVLPIITHRNRFIRLPVPSLHATSCIILPQSSHLLLSHISLYMIFMILIQHPSSNHTSPSSRKALTCSRSSNAPMSAPLMHMCSRSILGLLLSMQAHRRPLLLFLTMSTHHPTIVGPFPLPPPTPMTL